MISIATRLVAILTSLRQALTAFAVRESRAQSVTWLGTQAYRPVEAPNQPPRLPAESWALLHTRLGRLAARFTALFMRWQTNTLPAPRVYAPRPYAPHLIPRLPTARGWINIRIAEAAPCAGMLDILLREPDLPRFLAAAPQAGRLLRPLVRALGLPEPDLLKRPVRPKPVRPPPTQPSHAPPPPTEDRPLPAYVRAAARAWRKHDR